MKKSLVWISLVLGLVTSVMAERYRIVRITDMFGTQEFEVMTPEDHKALQNEIKEERAVFPKVLAKVKKAVHDDEELRKVSVAWGRIRVRDARQMGPEYMNQEKAEAKKERQAERLADKLAKETEKHEAKMERMKEEDVEVYTQKQETFQRVVQMVMKEMSEKLGRPVPSFGFAVEMTDKDKKADNKKDDKKDKKEKEKDKKEKNKKDNKKDKKDKEK